MLQPLQPFSNHPSFSSDARMEDETPSRVEASAKAAMNSIERPTLIPQKLDSDAERDPVREFALWLDYLPAKHKGDLVKRSLEELQGNPLRVKIVRALLEIHPDLSNYLRQIDGVFSFNTTSVQLICDYLKEKGSLPENIDLSIVSTKKRPPSEELEFEAEAELTEAIFTWAMNSASNEDKYIVHYDGGHFGFFYLHKDSDTQISLFHLDSLGFYPEPEEQDDFPENNIYLIEKALVKLEKSGKEVTNYLFSFKRQNSFNTCSIFAIRDLVATARNPWALRKTARDSVHATAEKELFPVFYFNKLPPDLAKSTDSMTYLNEYKKESRNPKVHTKKSRIQRTPLERFLKLHQKTHPETGKIQNGYISDRQTKYGHVVIKKFFDDRAAAATP